MTILRWVHKKGEYRQVAFKEKMIDHLELESRSVLIDQQEEMDTKSEANKQKDDNKNESAVDDEITKRANHFAFLDRATQTKVFEIQETESQTDPPPV